MKFTIFVAVFAVIFAMAFAYPHEIDAAIEGPEETELQHGLRHKRATCDILASEPFCAAHCLAKGFKGGWCDYRKVCNCRN